MKLSKEEFEEVLMEAAHHTSNISGGRCVEIHDAFINKTIEIEGYERVEWTRFDPDNPKTFPPKNECLDIFECSKKHEFRAENKLNEFWWQRVVERWVINVNSRGYTIYWRPLPPPPGKEEAK